MDKTEILNFVKDIVIAKAGASNTSKFDVRDAKDIVDFMDALYDELIKFNRKYG